MKCFQINTDKHRLTPPHPPTLHIHTQTDLSHTFASWISRQLTFWPPAIGPASDAVGNWLICQMTEFGEGGWGGAKDHSGLMGDSSEWKRIARGRGHTQGIASWLARCILRKGWKEEGEEKKMPISETEWDIHLIATHPSETLGGLHYIAICYSCTL